MIPLAGIAGAWSATRTNQGVKVLLARLGVWPASAANIYNVTTSGARLRTGGPLCRRSATVRHIDYAALAPSFRPHPQLDAAGQPTLSPHEVSTVLCWSPACGLAPSPSAAGGCAFTLGRRRLGRIGDTHTPPLGTEVRQATPTRTGFGGCPESSHHGPGSQACRKFPEPESCKREILISRDT